MKIIIGLGNPEEKYAKTRHNIGFRIIDYFAKETGNENWQFKKQLQSLIIEAVFEKEKIVLAKPQTYMNNSGDAARTLLDYFKTQPDSMIVVHDDIDLVFGEMRLQKERGSAGHKGVESVINALETKNFSRLRIGIKPFQCEKEIETDKFVLQDFTKEEEKNMPEIMKKAAQLIIEFL